MAVQNIDEAFERIERLTQLSQSQTHLNELVKLQNLLALNPSLSEEEVRPSCYFSPTTTIPRFHNRNPSFEVTDKHVESDAGMRAEADAIALYKPYF